MKALVSTCPGRIELLERALPEPGPGQVRIRTAACGICATDLEMIAGWARADQTGPQVKTRTGFPAVPGHEWSGIVDAVGRGVDPGLVGRPCVAENILEDGGEVGFEHPGGYGQYLLNRSQNLHFLPDAFPLTQAVLIEPLAVCTRALGRLRVQDHSSALISGDGPIGLMMLMLLRRVGVEKIVLVGGRTGRLALARELGAAAAIDHRQGPEGLAQNLRDIQPNGFANVVEASGSPAGARAAVEQAAKFAHVLILGDYLRAQADFCWNDLLHREIELIGSNASAGGWDGAVAAALSGELPLQKLVSWVYPLQNFRQAFDLVYAQDEAVVKVVLDWLGSKFQS
jgi:threonine dehydrogenase-like Zn-dependent dehydrogenase